MLSRSACRSARPSAVRGPGAHGPHEGRCGERGGTRAVAARRSSTPAPPPYPAEQQPDLSSGVSRCDNSAPVYGLFRPRPSAAVVPAAAAYATSARRPAGFRSGPRSCPPLTVRVAAVRCIKRSGTRPGSPAATMRPMSTRAGRRPSPFRRPQRQRRRGASRQAGSGPMHCPARPHGGTTTGRQRRPVRLRARFRAGP